MKQNYLKNFYLLLLLFLVPTSISAQIDDKKQHIFEKKSASGNVEQVRQDTVLPGTGPKSSKIISKDIKENTVAPTLEKPGYKGQDQSRDVSRYKPSPVDSHKDLGEDKSKTEIVPTVSTKSKTQEGNTSNKALPDKSTNPPTVDFPKTEPTRKPYYDVDNSFEKTFTGKHLNSSIESTVKITCRNIQLANYNAELSLRVASNFNAGGEYTYRSFSLQTPDFQYLRYALKIGANQYRLDLDVSGKVEYDQLFSGRPISYEFESKQQPADIKPLVVVEDRYAAHSGPTESTVDSYYKACDDLESLDKLIASITFLSNDNLSNRKMQIDGIWRKFTDIWEQRLSSLLPLQNNDPKNYLILIGQIPEKLAKKDLECLQSALYRLQKLGLDLQSLKFNDPDNLKNEGNELVRIETQFAQISEMKFDPSNSQIGDKNNDFLQKVNEINESLKLKRLAQEEAKSNTHLYYFKKGMESSSKEQRRSYFEKAIKSAPPNSFADPHYELAVLEYKDDQYDNAISQLNQALAANPSPEIYKQCNVLFVSLFNQLIKMGDESSGENKVKYYETAKKCVKATQ